MSTRGASITPPNSIHRHSIPLLRPLLSLPPLPLPDCGPPCAAVAARTVEPASDPLRQVLDRTDCRDVQECRWMSEMRRALQPTMRGAFGPLVRRSLKNPLTGEPAQCRNCITTIIAAIPQQSSETRGRRRAMSWTAQSTKSTARTTTASVRNVLMSDMSPA